MSYSFKVWIDFKKPPRTVDVQVRILFEDELLLYFELPFPTACALERKGMSFHRRLLSQDEILDLSNHLIVDGFDTYGTLLLFCSKCCCLEQKVSRKDERIRELEKQITALMHTRELEQVLYQDERKDL